ncbi:hypothetical protein [Aliikangiella sp. G2MR2-5]|uniref:hypothetical protein n=1 Tax=Aliikangiella sp. G2MR2-5 TaxID=2788943 RepID=UPI0018AA3569|nr:hypothetical protein [Aliikangiella sp. G2MR2-5]
MRYYPYASLEATKFKSLLKLAQRLGAASIYGFYLTLTIATIIFFGMNSTPENAHLTNGILLQGIIICGSGLAVSAVLALLVTQLENRPQTCEQSS